MEMLNFKQGNSKSNLLAAKTQNGTFYLVKELNELYIDLNNQRYKITDTSGLQFVVTGVIDFGSTDSNNYFILNQSILNGTNVLR